MSEDYHVEGERLDVPADAALLDDLEARGLLSPHARRAALAWLRPPDEWRTWADRTLLVVGAALVLAGVVFFFAYNWATMGRFLRFGVLQGALALCLLGAWRRGLDDPSGKTLVAAASVLVGVHLAVYGQAYQTGADAYELFAGWAALITGFAIAARMGGLWFLWLVVVNLGVGLWYVQVRDTGWTGPLHAAQWLAVLNAVALGALEALRAAKAEWAARPWLRGATAFLVFALAAAPACHWAVTLPLGWGRGWDGPAAWPGPSSWVGPPGWAVPSAPLLLGAFALLAGTFYGARRDLVPLTVMATALAVVTLALVVPRIFSWTEWLSGLLLAALAVAAVTAAEVDALKHLARRWKGAP